RCDQQGDGSPRRSSGAPGHHGQNITLDVVRVPLAAFPAGSRSVVAGVYDHVPETAVVLSWVQEPAHGPVTVNVTVLRSALSVSVPAKVTVYVLPKFGWRRYPVLPVLSWPLVNP